MPFPLYTQPGLCKELAFSEVQPENRVHQDTGRHGQGYFCRSNPGSSEKGVEGVRLENYRQPSLFATPKRPDMYILFWYVPSLNP